MVLGPVAERYEHDSRKKSHEKGERKMRKGEEGKPKRKLYETKQGRSTWYEAIMVESDGGLERKVEVEVVLGEERKEKHHRI